MCRCMPKLLDDQTTRFSVLYSLISFVNVAPNFLSCQQCTQLKANSPGTKSHTHPVRSTFEPRAPRQYMPRKLCISTTLSSIRLSRQPGGHWKNSWVSSLAWVPLVSQENMPTSPLSLYTPWTLNPKGDSIFKLNNTVHVTCEWWMNSCTVASDFSQNCTSVPS